MSEVKTNKISSLASNNDITIDPDGTGDTIIASGNLGVGTSSPSYQATIYSSSASTVEIESGSDTGESRIYFTDPSTTGVGEIGYYHNGNSMRFNVNNAERMRINENGNLLIGRTNTDSNNGGHFITSDYAFFEDNGAPLFLNRFSSDGSIAIFRKQNSNVGDISVTGSGTSYNTSSDYRLKENVTYDWDATTRLKQLKPARFNFIVDADTTVDGFLAHEAQAVVPEAVTGTHNEVDDDGNPVMQGIDQSKLVPLLVKTIQELEARITALEAE